MKNDKRCLRVVEALTTVVDNGHSVILFVSTISVNTVTPMYVFAFLPEFPAVHWSNRTFYMHLLNVG